MAINVILARSPYQVIIDETDQISTKVELRLWNKPDSRPTTPTYIMSEGIASVTQTETNYNISPFILEYIDKYNLVSGRSSTVIEANNNEWCIGEYTRYYTTDGTTWNKIDETDFCAVNGYSKVENGVNYDVAKTKNYLLLANQNIKVYWSDIVPYYNFICRDTADKFTAKWYNSSNTLLASQEFYSGADNFFNYFIPLVSGASVKMTITSNLYGVIYTVNTEEVCEPTYTTQTMWFVNQFGGWNYFTFFKASYNSIDVKNSDYSLMQKQVDYDYQRGQTKPFNINGSQSIKVNSGWITEDYFEWIQDIMLSDTILYGAAELPVTIKTTSMQKKTYIKDKNINYTLEFDFANKLINNIV